MKVIRVKDGEDISILAELQPSVADPVLAIPAVAQTFRVIANSFGPTLSLTALTSRPVEMAGPPLLPNEYGEETVKTVYTVPLHCGQVVEVPEGTEVRFYVPKTK